MNSKLMKYVSMAYYYMNAAGVNPGTVTQFTINKRAVSRFGRCCRKGDIYAIEISELLLYDGCEIELLDTIIHELCHAIPGTTGHGEKWRNAMNKVNAVLPPGFKAQSKAAKGYGTCPQQAVEDFMRKHKRVACSCPHCGTKSWLSRKTAKNYKDAICICGKCGYQGSFDIA